MKTSEFWLSLEAVFGHTLGHSLAQDLYLTAVGNTAVDALNAGVDPDRVWAELIAESGAPEQARWIHRMDARERRRLQLPGN